MLTPTPVARLLTGDARQLERHLREAVGESPVMCTVTSPPYAALKDYGHVDQIGHGQSLGDYMDDCERVFAAVGRVSARDGTMWLVADTAVDQSPSISRLLPLPFMLAERAERHGWVLRDVAVWHKDRTSPWSGRGRLRNAFEYVLMFVRSESFKYRLDRVRSEHGLTGWWERFPERYHPLGAAPTNVWDYPIPRQGAWTGSLRHACPLPPAMVERMILLSSDPGDLVFDPFAGTGIVAAQAERLGRVGIGLDVVADHAERFEQVRATVLADPVEPQAGRLSAVVPVLRALKYPRALSTTARRTDPTLPTLALSGVVPGEVTVSEAGLYSVASETVFVLDAPARTRRSVEATLHVAATKAPASKYGITGEVRVLGARDGKAWLSRHDEWWLYRGNRAWSSRSRVGCGEAMELLAVPAKSPHVCSDVLVDPVA